MSSAPSERRGWGLRARIVICTSAVLSVALAGAFLWSAYNLRAVLQNRNDTFLLHELSEIKGALDEQPAAAQEAPTALEALRRECRAAEDAGLFVVLELDGVIEVLPSSEAAAQFEQAVRAFDPAHLPGTIPLPGDPTGVRTASAVLKSPPGHHWIVVLGLPLAESEQTAASFNSRLAAGGILFLVVAVLGGLVLTRLAIQPVADSIAAARRLNPADLSARLPRTRTGDELDLLAATVNELLERVAQNHQQVVQFTADASHELRSPLTAMQAAIEVALQQSRTTGEYQELLATLGEQCQRLTDLVNDLLLLAKADAGQIELQRAPVDLENVVAEVVETYKPLAEEKGIALAAQGAERLEFAGDRMRLLQLTMNLVDNAIKFTPAGGTVRINLAANGAAAILTVEDTGIGIAADRLPRIFERFYQADESRSAGGTGLGLNICRWVAQAHGGAIEVSSQPGQGSSFRVWLPMITTTRQPLLNS